jgi:hypothetical protein
LFQWGVMTIQKINPRVCGTFGAYCSIRQGISEVGDLLETRRGAHTRRRPE